jgi:hypothetical protein
MKTRNRARLKRQGYNLGKGTRARGTRGTQEEQDKHKTEVWLPERKELPRPPGGRSLVYRRISIYPTNTPRNLGHVYR